MLHSLYWQVSGARYNVGNMLGLVGFDYILITFEVTYTEKKAILKCAVLWNCKVGKPRPDFPFY